MKKNTMLTTIIIVLAFMLQTAWAGMGQISDAITLSGAIELDYSYSDDSAVDDNTVNDSTSDLDIGTLEIGLEAALHENLTAVVLLKGEGLADSDGEIDVDEAFFEIKKGQFYLVAGKKALPFGVFASNFINDPLTQELYEINDTGLTIGFADDKIAGLDLSLTIYKGETLITTVNDAGYGWARGGTTTTNDVNSYIFSGSVSPVENLSLSAFVNSEPGDSDRNNTAGAAVSFAAGAFLIDAEYIAAMQRELNSGQEYKENAWTIELAYQVTDPMLLALRYEAFDADQSADGNLENRMAAAVTYNLVSNDTFSCDLMGEVRHSEYEDVAGGSADDELNEIFVRLAVSF